MRGGVRITAHEHGATVTLSPHYVADAGGTAGAVRDLFDELEVSGLPMAGSMGSHTRQLVDLAEPTPDGGLTLTFATAPQPGIEPHLWAAFADGLRRFATPRG
jgi:hypothetical protein